MVSKLERVPLAVSLVVLGAAAVVMVSLHGRPRLERPQPAPAIALNGNHMISSAELRAAVIDVIGRDAPPFTQEEAERAALVVSSVYWDRGYVMARVAAPRIDPALGSLVLAIDNEGEKFTLSDVRIRGELLGDAAANLAHMQIRSGMVFSRTAIATDLAALNTFYQDAGYAYATVVPFTKVDVAHATLALQLEVTRGVPTRFGRVAVVDHDGAAIATPAVHHAVTIAAGQPFAQSPLIEVKQRLGGLGYDVAVSTARGTTADRVDVTFEVSTGDAR